MTEAEWLACTDPNPMLEFLRGKASDRKLRLFAVACVRPYVLRINEARIAQIVNVSEAYADQEASWNELAEVRKMARLLVQEAMQHRGQIAFGGGFVRWVQATAHPTANVAARTAAERASDDILRDIFGNPFRPATVPAAVVVWKDRTIPKLAQAIYDERAFDRMPILADALEEAVCNNEEMLNHCRRPGVHVRGCWVVDLVLGKE
jgi:hypothetical protein